ncbi:hypothetical protein [Kitasatospora sp. GP82]|uniref:hypothetical protein n=1 Tax=Kitasatospora sp. GP82 TaxID=3035089 RepID=UPI0024767E8E|nr:hypothetical protein [Kitasatospora sp. GP82]
MTSLAFSPDGTTLATVTGGTALLWSLGAASPLAAPIAFDTGASAGVESQDRGMPPDSCREAGRWSWKADSSTPGSTSNCGI